jgi:hypothetical protein
VNRVLLGFPKCPAKGDPCELWPDLVTPVHAIGWAIVWAVVASLFVCLVFTLLGRTGAGTVIALGCGFWALSWIVVLLLGLQGGGVALVAVPIVAYGVAGVVAGSRPRSSPHGEVTDDSP